MKKHKPTSGFSFFEIMVALLILGIIATSALPSLKSGVNSSRLSAATAEIVTALEYARLYAITTSAQTRVTINASADTLLVQRFKNTANLQGSETQLPKADVEGGAFVTMSHPYNKGANYSMVFSNEDRFYGVDIVSSVFLANNYVTFGTLGVPSSAGAVRLMLGSTQVTITVNGITGRVTTSG